MRWIVFDFGEVVGLRSRRLPELAGMLWASAGGTAAVRDSVDSTPFAASAPSAPFAVSTPSAPAAASAPSTRSAASTPSAPAAPPAPSADFVARFEAAYWELRDHYDRGLSDTAYWQGIAARVAAAAPADAEVAVLADAEVAALVDVDIAGWLDADPDAVALLEKLHADGQALALLSNAPSSHGEAFRRQPWSGCFRHFLISGDLDAAKPDPEIWRILTRRLDAAPGDCLFLDDRQVNVDAAAAAGVRAHRWTGAEAAAARIAAFLAQPSL